MKILTDICNIAALIVPILCAMLVYFQYRLHYWQKKGVPATRQKFPFGETFEVLKQKVHFSKFMQERYKYFKAKGCKFYGIYAVTRPIFIPIDKELIHKILVTDFTYFSSRGMYYNESSDPISGHLLYLEGSRWKNIRYKLTPAFTLVKIKMMFDLITTCALSMVECIAKESANGNSVEFKSIAVRYSNDVICSCGFGIETNSLQNPDDEISKIGPKIISHVSSAHRLRYYFTRSFPKMSRFLRMKVYDNELSEFFTRLFKQIITTRKKSGIVRNDFIKILLELIGKGEHDGLSLTEATTQAFSFYLAGLDTSSTTISFCVYELAKNASIQNKLRENIIQILKNHNGRITYEAVSQMVYMEQVLGETLRKYPVGPTIPRLCTRNYTIPGTNVTIEKGTAVFIPVISVHRDPEYYPEPENFIPERIPQKEFRGINCSSSNLSFGLGPRICIGLKFGLLQMKIALCHLLVNYKLSLDPKTPEDQEPDPAVPLTYQSKGGHWLFMEKIDCTSMNY